MIGSKEKREKAWFVEKRNAQVADSNSGIHLSKMRQAKGEGVHKGKEVCCRVV